MKILVPMKRVIDYNVKPRVKSDGAGDAGISSFIAINRDKDASIFRIADIGLVAEPLSAAPELTQAL